LHKNQVGFFTGQPNVKKKHRKMWILGEEVQQHNFIVKLQQAGQVICSSYQQG
jgi:hypothetical protein